MPISTIFGLLVLFVGAPLNFIVTWILWRRVIEAPDVKVLLERLIASIFMLMVTIVFGLIFLNNDSIPPLLGLEWTKIITRISMLVMAIAPATYWLWLYFGDRGRG